MITVHIRRGDFGGNCPSGQKPPCFVPVDKYKSAVDAVRAELLRTRGLNVDHVMVASGAVIASHFFPDSLLTLTF